MATTKRVFIPFNDLTPDAREFNNEGLTQALNVAPVGDTYVPARAWQTRTAALPNPGPGLGPRGLHVHPSTSSSTWYGYWGTVPALYEASNTSAAIPWTVTNKTRLVGGPYVGDGHWNGTSFGDSVIMTNYDDDPQILTSPAAANFTKLAQSGGANPGMDPKARFVFPVRGNLFLANLNLAAPFDGLAAGANPNVVAWSQSENCRQFGSFNVTPQLTGTGYQPLNYDLGAITGGVGGQYALVSMQRGWVRADGPPYTFRPISLGVGNLCSNGIVRFDDDVYFWGPAGPMVLRGGEGPAIALGKDKVVRVLTDDVFGGPTLSAGIFYGADPYNVSAGADHLNRHVWWSFPSATHAPILIYDVDAGRFSFQLPQIDGDNTNIGFASALQTRPDQLTGWAAGRDLVSIFANGIQLIPTYYLASPVRTETVISCVFEKGYMQFDEELTTRVLRVRPIYSLLDSTVSPIASVDISSKNKPFDSATPATFSGLDTHGWITTPTTTFADFHRIKLTLTMKPRFGAEISGIEVEVETGGVYAA